LKKFRKDFCSHEPAIVVGVVKIKCDFNMGMLKNEKKKRKAVIFGDF